MTHGPIDPSHFDNSTIDTGDAAAHGGGDADSPGSAPEAGAPETTGSAEGDPAQPRKRRRRGGRGRKRKTGEQPVGETGAPSAESDADATPDDAAEDSENAPAPARQPDAPAPRRQSDRQGPRSGDQRRGRGGDRAPRGDKGDRGPRHEERHERAPEPVKTDEPRIRTASGVTNWEEIFGEQTWESLGLRNSVLKGIAEAGFKAPTKIQAAMIPLIIAGKDVLGQSRTGTGKTAAFGIPLYQCAQRQVPFQSIILCPTRELAIQIAQELTELGRFTPIKISAVYGGSRMATQIRELGMGPEIIVATPGRLLDMKERGHLHFNNVKFIVLDEVDRMLDIGFRDDIRRILSQIRGEHQTVFVSATIAGEIEKLARSYMKDPEKLVTSGSSLTVSLVQQHYISVQPWDKRRLLAHLLTHQDPDLTLVFCRTKRTVDDLTEYLRKKNIDAHAIHGDMYQGKRNSVMSRMRKGELGVLVASDLASRGLDVDGISHVVNYDLPEDPEIYVHRIGRTARAGRGGVAWSLCTPEQGELLTAVEVYANTHIPELKFPEFEPGPVPGDVRQRVHAEQKAREERSKQVSRFASPTLPPSGNQAAQAPASGAGASAPAAQPAKPSSAAAKSSAPAAPAPLRVAVDANKFPGGIVPTKLPPKRMQGRIPTSRSPRPAAPAAAPAPDAPSPAAGGAGEVN